MDTRQLEAFCAVVDRRSFSQAAVRLGVSQPAVSLQVRALEKRLGTQLLDRSGRRVEPTEAGWRLYRGAQKLLALEEQIESDVASIADGELQGQLVLGASTGPAAIVVPLLLCEFQRQNPGVHVSLMVSDTHTVVERVASRELELGIVGASRRHRGVRFEPFFSDEVILACPPGHRFAGRAVSVTELRDEPLILMQEGAGVRQIIEDALVAAVCACETSTSGSSSGSRSPFGRRSRRATASRSSRARRSSRISRPERLPRHGFRGSRRPGRSLSPRRPDGRARGSPRLSSIRSRTAGLVIVRWGLGEVGPLLSELGSTRPLLVTSARFADLDVPLESRFTGVRRHSPVEVVQPPERRPRAPISSSAWEEAARSTPPRRFPRRPACRSSRCRRRTPAPSGRRYFGMRDEQQRKKTGGTGARTVAIVYEPLLTLDLPLDETVGTALNALAHCAEALYAGP